MSKPPGPKIKNQKSKIENATDWSSVAAWYDQLVGESGSDYHRNIVLPGALRLLNPQPNEQILDLACGQGVLSRLLAAKGAHCTGVDSSKELIHLARERNSSLPTADCPLPTFLIGDARNLSFLPEKKFDSAACLLAIQNIHPLQPVFQSAAR